jgi:hypothetical protein
MTKSLRIGVKFCGNCNPHISGGDTLRQIKDKAANLLPEAKFVTWDSQNLDALLVISGCPVDCATRPEVDCPQVAVAGESVNMSACSADQVAGHVFELLRRNKGRDSYNDNIDCKA